ncbi:MAG TPA: DUF1016 N-terminal domain-containing protein [candidate division Zixibacteria bacterium]|nr:DUF1016 N-terminal domain-containing protein [candidate division Zixibacteria bacterium]
MSAPFDSYGALLARLIAAYEDGLKNVSPQMQNQRSLEMHWHAGRIIVEDEQGGAATATYGSRLMKRLAGDMSVALQRSVSDRQLLYERKFFNEYEISHVRAELNWTHYKALLEVRSKRDRSRLETLAIQQGLGNAALQQLVREVNAGKADCPDLPRSAKKTLVPRDGRLNLVKVVTVREGRRTRRMADCGFRQLAPLCPDRPRQLQDGALLEWRAEGGRDALVTSSCAPGQQYCYEGHAQSVIDGDTLVVVLKLSLNLYTIQKLRLRGVNAPESGTPAGAAARERLAGLVGDGAPLKVLTYHWDMYGRYVADVFAQGPDGALFVNEELRGGQKKTR